MAVDKVRIPKSLQKQVEEWSTALEISEGRLVGDAIRFYLRHLNGKPNIQQLTTLSPITDSFNVITITDAVEDDEEYEGDLEL